MQEKGKESALCQHGFSERNNYYFGKLMTARDFTDEQRYLNEKRWMVNRLGLGWGVLCGLKVRPHAHDRRKVVVEPGFAIDPYGHEVLVCREEAVDLLPVEQDDCPPPPPEGASYLYYLSIKYEECGVNPSPVMIDSCEGYKEECVYNRTREGYRFIVSLQKPDSLAEHDHECDARCHRLLQDPSPGVTGCCPERPECEPVPLAAICYNEMTDTTVMDIDQSMNYRKLAFSNQLLFELVSCLREGAGQGWGARHNRQQHVPLLASTIRGLKYRDGRNATLDSGNGYEGVHPHRLTSDGDYIWVTDRESTKVWRVDRATNDAVSDDRLDLDDPTWGIAFDGRYMWLSHHDSFRDEPAAYSKQNQIFDAKESSEAQDYVQDYGKLTRVDVCTLERWTIDGLPVCHTLPKCYRFPEPGGAPETVRLRPYAGEVVLHGGDIYVAHDVPKGSRQEKGGYGGQYRQQYELSLTRIDPARGCIVDVIDVPESDGRVPLSGIVAMASDGDALWITYRASSMDKKGERAVARRITRQDGATVVSEPYRLGGETPEHIAFDGTRVWVSHNDGVSVLDIESGEAEEVNTDLAHTALAYTGGPLLWAVVPGKNEASLTWIDIFSEAEGQRIEFIEVDPQTTFEVTDMQFDGTYLYVAYYRTEGEGNRGVIHRLLP
ncbi:MAG TPA: hypothetical protein VGX48_08295 [Pyrinomonadaceae bacterium]|jgi:hypothetical protein|nr:hypothetical protein [Pyrinomonadaceae bacterium]